jgi:hypothetical protein
MVKKTYNIIKRQNIESVKLKRCSYCDCFTLGGVKEGEKI